MKNINYLIQYIIIIFLFLIFKCIGHKIAINLSGYIFTIFGPLFRSKKIIFNNFDKVFPKINIKQKKRLLKEMWFGYGQIFSEYVFIKKFRDSNKFRQKIIIKNKEILNQIKLDKEPVIFISGHFNNFELMAQSIELYGIDLATVYRPLNNKLLNPIMENIRKKYICKNQIKKGISGTKKLLQYFKKNTSVAMMIDQRVSEGINVDFFGQKALTTTIPAQFVKKFKSKIVPVHIERTKENKFIITFFKPLVFLETNSIREITLQLNKLLEKMIMINPSQWIWTHNRWK